MEMLDNPYQEAMEILDNYYDPRMSLCYKRFRFLQLQINPHDTLDQFTMRLRSQESLCGFEEQIEVMDQIATKEDDKLKAKYLESDTSLEEILKIGRTYESVKQQVQEFRSDLPHSIVPAEELNGVGRKKVHKLCGRCAT